MIANDSSLWAKQWPAPAKINLMLRITGRRDDGYHLLQTVFQMTEWCDWIKFQPLEADVVCLKTTMSAVLEADNLIVRAAQILKKAAACAYGVEIEIEKNLPMGGGLGGGSSNAATTLLVLNKLWQLNFSTQQLMDLGLALGADVPVFIYGYATWAEGVGEKFTKITIPEQWLVIIQPDCQVNTGEIFSAKNLTRASKSIKMSDFLAGQQQNDCLEVVCELYQPVEKALLAMSEFANAKLTGTGACVFAQFDSKVKAEQAYATLKSNDWIVYLTKGINKSPLLVKLEGLNG